MHLAFTSVQSSLQSPQALVAVTAGHVIFCCGANIDVIPFAGCGIRFNIGCKILLCLEPYQERVYGCMQKRTLRLA